MPKGAATKPRVFAGKFRTAFSRGGIAPLLDALWHAAQSIAFNLRYGVDTIALGIVPEIPERYGLAQFVHYAPTRISPVKRILSERAAQCGESTFVNRGSGKRRILLLASHFPFRRIVGVDFDPELRGVAQRKDTRPVQKWNQSDRQLISTGSAI